MDSVVSGREPESCTEGLKVGWIFGLDFAVRKMMNERMELLSHDAVDDGEGGRKGVRGEVRRPLEGRRGLLHIGRLFTFPILEK